MAQSCKTAGARTTVRANQELDIKLPDPKGIHIKLESRNKAKQNQETKTQDHRPSAELELAKNILLQLELNREAVLPSSQPGGPASSWLVH